MSPAMQMTPQPLPYTPTSDAMDRHEYGVTKNRKATSTGGGRAWSEDEEIYLLQTRLQKMPYKHIAAHLKKTELACRLHYHQLSHGSNRRKRTTSMSSGSSNSGHSPILQATIPSPIHEHGDAPSRSVSPLGSAGSYGSASPGGIQLPSIMSATASTNTSPRLPTILPKPTSMTLALASIGASGSTGTASPTASRGYPTPLHESHPHSATLMTSAALRGSMTPTNAATSHSAHGPDGGPHHHGPGPLRLDCSALPPPPSSGGFQAPPAPSHPVDMGRLTAVYNAHRASFWAAVAADYGAGANPLVLEQAWRGTGTSPTTNLGIAAQTPITPIGSPDDHVYGVQGKPDKTRISAILGIDANPRSPREREMVRRMEEEKCSVGVGVVGA
ncbi:Myb-like domain-containing protein [Madurella fahalii]|uniref:Myb-like domain-containing protein n=1 Tax=Madurella fahalii TaxID=1157608 RepID=A0ABQ0GTK5_9PEZI